MFLRFFVIISFFFGTILVFITPPCQTPDEKNHFFRAYHLSNGNLMGEKRINRLGGEIPVSVDSFATTFMRLQKTTTSTTNWYEIVQFKNQKLNQKNVIFADFNNTGFFSPLGYFYTAIVIFISKLLQLSPLLCLWFARWIALCLWIFLIFQSLKLLHQSRNLFLILALLPASLAVNVSLSPDMLCNGLCFLCIAIVLHFLENSTIMFSNKFKIIFGLSLIAIVWIKIVYLPIIFSLLLIPNFFRNNKFYFYFLLLFCFSIIVSWSVVSSNLFIYYEDYAKEFQNTITTNEGVNHKKQFLFICNNLFLFFNILFHTILDYFPSTMVHLVGKFGWEKNYLAFFYILLLWLIIILQLFKNYTFNVINRIYFILIGCILVFCFSIVMYMLWTPVGELRIWSFGGRYFIPILPFFLLSVAGIKVIPIKYHLLLDIWSIFGVIICNFALIEAIISRYYSF